MAGSSKLKLCLDADLENKSEDTKGLTLRGMQEFSSMDSLLMVAMECEPILDIYELLQQRKLWTQIGPRPCLVFSLP